MRASELIHKIISMLSSSSYEIPLTVFRGALPMSGKHAESFGEHLQTLNNSHIYINESPYTTMLDIETELRRFTRQNQLDVVFVDYMSLIADETGGSRARHEQIQDNSMRFKRLAKSLALPIVLLSQIKNDAYNKKPTMADISESTQLSRDADMIYLIWKPLENDNTRKVIIGEKGRNVSGGNFCVHFSQSTTEFTSMTLDDAIAFKNEFMQSPEKPAFKPKTKEDHTYF
jgi:replicative DNA helicase